MASADRAPRNKDNVNCAGTPSLQGLQGASFPGAGGEAEPPLPARRRGPGPRKRRALRLLGRSQ